ncbi:uncharacterized protein LOC124898504 [Capsicum annuum]|uniref:uncharacterized protein LOC124898504 n=1 Tax=Capsicum annuum TaxID=4072 RepID=UPI001FB11A89|nr:uncharacterized protein LOC124898504 [Capsicum annuum]
MAHLKTQMDFLNKNLLSAKTEKVKVVAAKGRDDSDLEEENNGSYIEIIIKSGKVLASPSMGKPLVDIVADDIEDAEIYHQIESRKSDEGKEAEVVVTTVPKLPPPFPHRLKKKANDTKFRKFIAMVKQLTINLPLVEALEKMPGYAKFKKDLISKKRSVSFEIRDNHYNCGVISTRSLVQKKADLGAFTIPYTIGPLDFAKALCDLGASINLMLLAVYKMLGLGDLTHTDIDF